MSDINITAGNVIPGARARFQDGILGATLTAGQVVYSDPADSGKLKAADANVAAATGVVGILANGGSSGQPARVITEDDDLTIGGALSMSAPVYILSATPGGIAPVGDIAAGWYPIVIGIAKSTTKLILKPLRGTAAAIAP